MMNQLMHSLKMENLFHNLYHIFINEKIQNICQNPKNIFQKQANNDATLKFLCRNNDFIRKSNQV